MATSSSTIRRCETCTYAEGFHMKHNVILLSRCTMPAFRRPGDYIVLVVAQNDGTECTHYKAAPVQVTRAIMNTAAGDM